MCDTHDENPKGFLYVLTHPSFFGWYKVGHTRVTTERRLQQYQHCAPDRGFRMARVWELGARAADVELTLIAVLSDRHRVENEWVSATEDEIDDAFESALAVCRMTIAEEMHT